jgi:hypothetical protein
LHRFAAVTLAPLGRQRSLRSLEETTMRSSPLLETMPDRDLASRYWTALGELQHLRHARPAAIAGRSGEELARNFQRIRELDELCERLWQEGLRRKESGGLGGNA